MNRHNNLPTPSNRFNEGEGVAPIFRLKAPPSIVAADRGKTQIPAPIQYNEDGMECKTASTVGVEDDEVGSSLPLPLLSPKCPRKNKPWLYFARVFSPALNSAKSTN